jgi:hypothetical protein
MRVVRAPCRNGGVSAAATAAHNSHILFIAPSLITEQGARRGNPLSLEIVDTQQIDDF